jgi:AmmeMemoRadiSam system protein B
LCVVPTAEAQDTLPLRSPFDEEVKRAVDALSEMSGSPDSLKYSGLSRLVGGIAPHHDLALDMIVRFYAELSANFTRRDLRRVWLLAPDHYRRARRFVAVCPSVWELSDGLLTPDASALDALRNLEIVETTSELFAEEHGISIHIPLIARFFPGANVVPIVLRRDIPDIALLSLRARMLEMIGDGDLVILSMDLSHYKPPEEMAAEDRNTLSVLTEMRPQATGRIDADARRAAALALLLFKDMGATRGELIERTDSSTLLGRRVESGTSYATIIYRRIEDL